MITDGFLQLLPDNDHRCEQLWSLAADAATRRQLWPGRQPITEAPLRNRPVRITVLHPGGGIGRFVDRIVAAEPGSVLVLHCGYLHPTTNCTLALRTVWGAVDEVNGCIQDCFHLASSTHLLQIQMSAKFDLARFVEGFQAGAGAGAAAAGNPSELSGRVLVIDNLGINLQLVECTLSGTHVQCECHTALPPALERVRHSHFDLIVCDAHLEPGRDEGVVGLLRGAGHRGAIILLVGDPKLVRSADQQLGPREVAIRVPATPPALLEHIAVMLHADPARRLPDRIPSSLIADPKMQPLLRDYCEFTRQQAERIRTAMSLGDIGQTRALCQELRENGGSFGFDLLSKAAAAAVTALDSTASINESIGELDYLLGAALRLSPTAGD